MACFLCTLGVHNDDKLYLIIVIVRIRLIVQIVIYSNTL